MSRTIAERLAAELVGAAARPLDPAVEQRALDLLRDHLGVALGGAAEESSIVVRRGLAALGGAGDAAVIGAAAPLPPAEAALANGAAAHALEMDDTHQGGSIHLGASVFPAALAAAALHPVPGARVLGAAVCGYEVGARLAMALDPARHYARGFHPTGTCGAFAAATAAALVLDLDAAGVAAALGIAGSQAAGSMEFLADGAWTKRLHPGWAACAGLHAAALARAGFRAPHTVFEGRFGVLHAYADGARAEPLAGRGTWELMRTSVKPHACCRYVQGPIDAALALSRRHGLAAEDVRRVEVGLVAAAFPIVCEPLEQKRRPRSVVDAQFSLPFGVAAALVAGAAGPDEFAPHRLDDPAIRRVMDVVEPRRDAALDARYPHVWPTWLRITRRDGSAVEEAVDHPRGDPESFPSREELAEKFRRLATRVLSPAAAARLDAAVDNFPTLARAADLLRLAQASGM